MLFEGTALWMSPTPLVWLCVALSVVSVIALIIALAHLSFEGFDFPGDKAVILGFGSFAAMAAIIAVIGFVQADNDRRAGQAALTAQAAVVYGVELRDTATSHLLANRGLYHLSHGGPQQMREQAGTAYIILDGEDVTLTLSWVDDAWVLLEGGTPQEPGAEMPRVDGRDN